MANGISIRRFDGDTTLLFVFTGVSKSRFPCFGLSDNTGLRYLCKKNRIETSKRVRIPEAREPTGCSSQTIACTFGNVSCTLNNTATKTTDITPSFEKIHVRKNNDSLSQYNRLRFHVTCNDSHFCCHSPATFNDTQKKTALPENRLKWICRGPREQ